jgi:predicted DNA-binding transcriptional regulator AlpA
MSIHSTGLSAEERHSRCGTPSAKANCSELMAQVDCVRSIEETAAILGLGVPTLRTMIAKGEGPQVTRLTERRIGIRDSHREAWLNKQAQPQPA